MAQYVCVVDQFNGKYACIILNSENTVIANEEINSENPHSSNLTSLFDRELRLKVLKVCLLGYVQTFYSQDLEQSSRSLSICNMVFFSAQLTLSFS